MSSEQAPAGLIGRDDEWRTARAILARVAEGVGAVLLVAGEAGIGKTALSEELYRVARGEGWRTAWATCAYGAVVPGLWPWRRILSALEGGDALVGVDVGDPVAARVALFDVIADRLAQASNEAPVLVVIDDAHWADLASAAMLLHEAATVRQGRVCVLATYRPEDAGAGSVLGELLPGLRRTSTELWLGPLGTEDVAALAATVAKGSDLSDTTRQRLATMTGGNPLFVTELMRFLPAGWTGDTNLRVSPTVTSLVGQRLAALPERARATLEIAAVIGTEFDVATLARALDQPPALVLADLHDTRRHEITHDVETGGFAFRHPLFRAALYDALGTAGRAAAHARVAAALE
ncbi:MAG: ATP-binding protein, partial [Acidimicrobiales bacterium]